ncbi:MAG: TetR family transcriptional regulator [Salinibacterium sp.]|nr:MAG: TetR family transcriptional regulator [Salinibacterium sp.]
MRTEAEPIPRMRAEDRRELVLEAATGVFGEFGYFGATTDQIAKAAGVSQPYVVRMFGTKEQLFLDVLQRALDRLLETFRGVLAQGAGEDLGLRMGTAYVELLTDRGLLLSLMHGFAMGSDPVIGAVTRDGFLQVYKFLREEAGFTPEQVRMFIANGMLVNTLVGLRMSDEYDTNPLAKECLCVALPEKLELVLALRESQR